MHTAKPLVTEPSPFEVDIVIEKFERHKLSGIDQILSEMIQVRGNTLHTEIYTNLLLLF
jgi:hypothetical protein